MAKYIDAERAERNGWYLQRTVTYSTAITGGCGCGYGYTETLKPTDYPAADVVEVVRCKDCKHREYDDFMKELVCDLDAADPYDRSRCAEDDEWFCNIDEAYEVWNGRVTE